MRFILPILMVAAFAVSIACQGVSPSSQTERVGAARLAEEAPRVSLADAKADFDAGTAVFVDSRPAEDYEAEHIKGAINVPFDNFEKMYKGIPTGKKIIVYCS